MKLGYPLVETTSNDTTVTETGAAASAPVRPGTYGDRVVAVEPGDVEFIRWPIGTCQASVTSPSASGSFVLAAGLYAALRPWLGATRTTPPTAAK